jgi:hypothetical protein
VSETFSTSSFFFFFKYWGLAQDLCLEPLRQPFFVKGIFEIGSRAQTICLGWLQTAILLISAS